MIDVGWGWGSLEEWLMAAGLALLVVAVRQLARVPKETLPDQADRLGRTHNRHCARRKEAS